MFDDRTLAERTHDELKTIRITLGRIYGLLLVAFWGGVFLVARSTPEGKAQIDWMYETVRLFRDWLWAQPHPYVTLGWLIALAIFGPIVLMSLYSDPWRPMRKATGRSPSPLDSERP